MCMPLLREWYVKRNDTYAQILPQYVLVCSCHIVRASRQYGFPSCFCVTRLPQIVKLADCPSRSTPYLYLCIWPFPPILPASTSSTISSFNHGQLRIRMKQNGWYYNVLVQGIKLCIKKNKKLSSSFTDHQSLFKLFKPLHESASMDGIGWQWFELDGSCWLCLHLISAVHIWRCHPHPAVGFLAPLVYETCSGVPWVPCGFPCPSSSAPPPWSLLQDLSCWRGPGSNQFGPIFIHMCFNAKHNELHCVSAFWRLDCTWWLDGNEGPIPSGHKRSQRAWSWGEPCGLSLIHRCAVKMLNRRGTRIPWAHNVFQKKTRKQEGNQGGNPPHWISRKAQTTWLEAQTPVSSSVSMQSNPSC